ncbi:ATP-binding cassette domain-containing protein [Arthrobacter sp. NPDC089319]|uniref:ABC transporter ATP-binding protein n=1 Tax=Arthrobacter sp. NPDC089319 TaxID=3155915 RepID=UPI0034387D2A
MTLKLENVAVRRGIGPVVHDVSFQVGPGQVATLVGPNGAGKTSLLEAISGILRTYDGLIASDGTDLRPASPRSRSRNGIQHVEQGRAIFPSLTVRETMRLATKDSSAIDRAIGLFPELHKRLDSPTALLSGGEQQMVVLARSILAEPKYLLIDEMSLGLAPVVFRRLLPVIRQIADSGVGVVLVEQFAHLALNIADEALVIANGAVTFQGDPQELLADETLLHNAYLGVAS